MTRLFIILILLATASADAANKYLRQGATGTGTGNDWTNAYTTLAQLETGLARGDTGYIADGSYAGADFNTPASGTALITVKKATVADHGTETGWVSTYGDGQATFTSGMWFSTSYWVFDGVVNQEWQNNYAASKLASSYGFTMGTMTWPFEVYNQSAVITDVTIASVSATAPGGDIDKTFLGTNNQTQSVHRVTIRNCLLNGFGAGYWATSPGDVMNDWMFERNVCLNLYSSGLWHGEWINNNYGLMYRRVTRYNLFEGGGMGATGLIVSNNNETYDDQTYGNVINDLELSNGIFTGTSHDTMMNPRIYHNTIISTTSNTGWVTSSVSGAIAQNNLLYNMQAHAGTGGRSYNAFFSCTSIESGETNSQVATGNPFVNLAAGNFRLASNTTAGTPLGSPYNVDVYGNTRTSNSRGAIEFVTGGDPLPGVTSATINTAGTQITIVFSEAVTAGAGGTGGFSLSLSGGAVSLGTPTGSGTTRVYPLTGRVIGNTETGTISYTQPGNGYEDSALQDMLTFTGLSVINNSTVPTAAAPTFSPVQGPYFGTQNIVITSTTPGYVIRYTTDGSDPTASSTQYVSPVPVTSGTTLKAITTASGYNNSSISTSIYEVGAWTSSGAWKSFAVPQQSGTHLWVFRASVSAANSDAVIGLSPISPTTWDDIPVTIRFNTAGQIDAINGADYGAQNAFAYSAGTTYEFVCLVNLANDTFSATVAPIGGQPVTIATNYAFRAEYPAASELDNVGMYGLVGSITASQMSIGPDSVAPTPNPMSFSAAPAAVNSVSITMTATTASDDYSNPVEYYFDETSGGAGGSDSGWQPDPDYIDSGLSPSTQYSYRVKARDQALNESSYSGVLNATTQSQVFPGSMSATTINAATLNSR